MIIMSLFFRDKYDFVFDALYNVTEATQTHTPKYTHERERHTHATDNRARTYRFLDSNERNILEIDAQFFFFVFGRICSKKLKKFSKTRNWKKSDEWPFNVIWTCRYIRGSNILLRFKQTSWRVFEKGKFFNISKSKLLALMYCFCQFPVYSLINEGIGHPKTIF